jgi:hypothetical protein
MAVGIRSRKNTNEPWPAAMRERQGRTAELDEDDDQEEARRDLERAQARVARLRKGESAEGEELGAALEHEREAAERYLRTVPSALSEQEERRRMEKGEDRVEASLRKLDEDRHILAKADQPLKERARWSKAELSRSYLQKTVSAYSDPAAAATIDRIRQIEGGRGA